MRKLTITVATLGFASLALAGPAVAGSGSSEKDNEVTCGASTTPGVVPGVGVYADPSTLEVCNQGDTVPVQGRVMVTGGTGGVTVAVDGDESNAQYAPEATSYARLDLTPAGPSYRCGDTSADDDDGRGGLDSMNPTENETDADCG